MPIMPCPQCHKRISSTTDKCPKCGHPLSQKDVDYYFVGRYQEKRSPAHWILKVAICLGCLLVVKLLLELVTLYAALLG